MSWRLRRAWALLWIVLSLGSASQAAEPVLSVQLAVRGGYVAIDAATTSLQLGSRAAVFESCGLPAEAMRAELISELDARLKARGKVIEFLAVPPPADPNDSAAAARRAGALATLQQLARNDANTAALYTLDAGWSDAANRIAQWFQTHGADQPPVTLGLRGFDSVYKAMVEDPALADGPLLPAGDGFDPSDPQVFQGRVAFKLAPPLMQAATRLKPSSNPDEWARDRGELSQALLEPFACKLWHRGRIVERVQDYLEMRGVSVQPYRTRGDAADAQGLVAESPAPPDRAGVAPARPSFSRPAFGASVVLSPDPLIDNVYVEADAMRDWPALRRVLYLLLPSADWQQVMSAPADHLCTMTAVWKPTRPPVVRLALAKGEGAQLALARTYLTRRAYAQRLQRLDALGYTAAMAFPEENAARQRKATNLLIERSGKPVAGNAAATGEGPALAACRGSMPPAADAAPASVPLSSSQPSSVVRPTAQASPADALRRHHLTFGAEREAGKPMRYSAVFSREGLSAQDTVTAEIGEQSRPSGKLQYSRDFVGFDALGRRVQLSAEVYSAFDPDRAALGTEADERRNGADVHATADLWRDRAGSFAQLDLGASRSTVILDGSNAQTTRLTLIDLAFFAAHSVDGTPSSARWELGASATLGQASEPGGRFAKLGLDAGSNRFIAAFSRWDVRLHVHHAGRNAPRTEWPAFGGEDSVRGYRVDAALSQTTWSLQNEYWMPLSALAGSNEGLARTLRRSAALALFADVGGLRDSATLPAGSKASLGAGLRLTLGDAFVLRLDWARAVGADAAFAARSGHWLMSVSSQRSL